MQTLCMEVVPSVDVQRLRQRVEGGVIVHVSRVHVVANQNLIQPSMTASEDAHHRVLVSNASRMRS